MSGASLRPMGYCPRRHRIVATGRKMNRKVSKIVLASLFLGGLIAVAGRDLAPAMPLWKLLLYVAGGISIAAGLVAVMAIAGGRWRQFGLNHGATDAQWMWFGGKPPGVDKARIASDPDQASANTDKAPNPPVRGLQD